MESLRLILLLISSVFRVSVQDIMGMDGERMAMTVRPDLVKKSEKQCTALVKEPFFEPEMVLGKRWRVYYTWSMMLEEKCVDLRFKLATPEIIRRFYYDMNEYLEEQPAWGAASLVLTMGKSKRQILLFDDQGHAGQCIGVPDLLRDGSMPPLRYVVPLLKFQMKLTSDKKYLIFSDCKIGIASIAGRYDQPINRNELEALAAELAPIFGQGHHSCTPNTQKEDRLSKYE